MAKQQYLTDRTLKALKPAKAGTRYEVRDTMIPGFGVRVGDASEKGKASQISFFLYTRYPRNPEAPTRRTIGRYGAISLTDARKRAGDWLEMVGRGIDPAIVLEQEKAAKARELESTFLTVAEKFIAHIKANGERKAEEVERDIRTVFLPVWGHRPIKTISAHDVAAVIEGVVKRGKRARAHNLFGHARRLFRWAVPLYLEHSPCALLSPKNLIGERVKRDRVLTDLELAACWRVAKRTRYPYGPIYRLLMLTGMRAGAVTEAEWSEIDKEKRVWIVPAARMKKTGGEAKPFLLPLTDAIIAELDTIPKLGKYLFPTSNGTPLEPSHLSKPKRRFDARMLKALRALARLRGDDPDKVTLPDWTNHDIRRTVRTNLPAIGIREDVSEALIAHAKKGITGTYNLYDYRDEKREALERWGVHLRTITEPKPANVVSLRGAR